MVETFDLGSCAIGAATTGVCKASPCMFADTAAAVAIGGGDWAWWLGHEGSFSVGVWGSPQILEVTVWHAW
jgi:hypothetical protein